MGTETLSLWYYPTMSLLYNFGDIRNYNDSSMQYGIGCFESSNNNNNPEENKDLHLLAGDYNGTMYINQIQPPKNNANTNQYNMNMIYKLQNGHTNDCCVRTFLNYYNENILITGGEDSRLCIWKLNDSAISSSLNGNNID